VKTILSSVLFITAGFCALPALLATPPPKQLNNPLSEFDDWIQSPHTHPLCGGYYCEPTPPFPGKSKAFLERQPITVTADRGEFQDTGTTSLTGHVHLIQGNRQVMADRATIQRSARTREVEIVTATGQVRILEPGLRLEGSDATLSIPEDKKHLSNTRFRFYQHHGRGRAQSILLEGKTRMTIKNGAYTTCSPLQNTWELRTKQLVLNRVTGRGQAKNAHMRVNNIPVFYFPYLDFPIDNRRQTGFLFPILGKTNRSGEEVAIPFYWNLAPNYDATLTPHFLSKRGMELQGQFRYLLPQGQGSLSASYLPHDRAYQRFKQTIRNQATPKFPSQDPRVTALNRRGYARHTLSIAHASTFNRHWSANVNYRTVGDDNHFMDFGNTLGAVDTIQLLQQGEILYQDEHWTNIARLQSYQTLHPYNGPATLEPYQRLPQFVVQNFYPDLPYGFEYATRAEFSNFNHKRNSLNQGPFTTGHRYHLRPSLAYPIYQPFCFFKPRLQCDMLAYTLTLSPLDTQNKQPKRPSRILPILDLDMGLFFERSASAFDTTLIQTLEPRAYYVYVPYKDQKGLPNFDSGQPNFDYNQLYRDNRFSGFDRLGDTHQLTLGLTSRVLDSTLGSERFNVSMGQILYFKHRQVTGCDPKIDPQCTHREMSLNDRKHSPITGLTRFFLHETWNVGASLEWDTDLNRNNKAAFFLQYHPSDVNVLNLGYQFLRKNAIKIDPNTQLPEQLQQADASATWALTEQWRILGRMNYDIRNKRSNETLLGVEQQGCCTAVRLSWMRFTLPNDGQRQYASGVFFQFIFKGFAGIGDNQLTSALSRSIPGYQWRNTGF